VSENRFAKRYTIAEVGTGCLIGWIVGCICGLGLAGVIAHLSWH
jgi:hypothetical protein